MWHFHLQSPSGALLTTLSEAFDRRLSFGRNRIPEVSFALDSEDEDAQVLEDALANSTPILRCSRDEEQASGPDVARVLRFAGIIPIAEEEAGAEAIVRPLAKGPLARLDEWPSADLRDFPFVDAGQIAWALIADANAEAPTGIVQGTIQTTVARDVTYERRAVGPAIAELSELDGGYDYEVAALDQGATLGRFDVFASQGTYRKSAVFGYGAGTVANVTSAKRLTRPPRNWVLVIGDEGVSQLRTDPLSIARFGRWPHVATMSDVIEADVLGAKAQGLIQPTPIRIVEFTPDPALAPVPLTDYGIGDGVALSIRRGSFRFDGTPRIDSIEIALDSGGDEAEHTITVAQPEEGA